MSETKEEPEKKKPNLQQEKKAESSKQVESFAKKATPKTFIQFLVFD